MQMQSSVTEVELSAWRSSKDCHHHCLVQYLESVLGLPEASVLEVLSLFLDGSQAIELIKSKIVPTPKQPPQSVGSSAEEPLALEKRNTHPRDGRVVFHEEGHRYVVDGVEYGVSVSGLSGGYFGGFNGEMIVRKHFEMWRSKEGSKYHSLLSFLERVLGMQPPQQRSAILAMWGANGKEKADLGTALHRQIELSLNYEPHNNSSVEFGQFLKWCRDYIIMRGWRPYRTEWAIFDEESGVAGKLDAVFEDGEGGYVLVDWKRAAQIPKNESGYVLKPFDGLRNTNLAKYTVQLNAYAAILRSFYGIDVGRMIIVQLHPDIPEYKVFDVERLDKEEEVFASRKASNE